MRDAIARRSPALDASAGGFASPYFVSPLTLTVVWSFTAPSSTR